MTWKAGESGNWRGRPRGCAARSALRKQVADALPGIVEKLVQLAVNGDTTAAKLILDRVLPPLRATDEGITLALPDNAAEGAASVVRAMAAGTLTPDQAAAMLSALERAQAIADHGEVARRLVVIEKWLRSRDN